MILPETVIAHCTEAFAQLDRGYTLLRNDNEQDARHCFQHSLALFRAAPPEMHQTETWQYWHNEAYQQVIRME